MKIAVLFGSFNPMTKAHISSMKNAVKAIGADKGLVEHNNKHDNVPLRSRGVLLFRDSADRYREYVLALCE